FAMAIRPDRRLALIAALFAAVTGRWVWAALSGMETTLFTALTLWGLLLVCARPRSERSIAPWVGATFLGLAALVRPEGTILLGLAIGQAGLEVLARARGTSLSQLTSRLIRSRVAILVGALLVAVALRLAYTL